MEYINNDSTHLFWQQYIDQEDDQEPFIEFDDFNDYYFNN